MIDLGLDLIKENYFLSKDVFKYGLSIVDIRVLLLLSTKKGLTVKTLNHKCKTWCVKKNNYSNHIFKEIEKRLIKTGLITYEGFGLDLKKDYLIFKDLEVFHRCKTEKQLFIESIFIWNKKHKDIILSEDLFKLMFPNRRAFNRACEGVGCNFTYIEKQNKVYIHKVEDDIKCVEKVYKDNPISMLDSVNLLLDEYEIEIMSSNEVGKEASIEDLRNLLKIC